MSPPNGVPPGSEDDNNIYLHTTTTTTCTCQNNDKSTKETTNHDECTQCSSKNNAEETTELLLVDNNKVEEITNDDDCEIDDDDDDAEVVVPPDGGWGWVVVFASFMCNMIVDGIIFSFGMFLNDIVKTFDVSIAQVTLLGSLMSGFYLIAGPFASALANRYGFQLVAIAGSILSASAFVLSYFATGIVYMCFTYGFLGGVGFGLIYVPSVITVGFYFERWRALATGIGVCGSGIGTFLFAPVSSALIRYFGWRGALLCQAAIVLTCVIFGALFRPLKPTKLKGIKAKSTEELKMDPSKLPKAARLKMEAAIEQIKKNSNSDLQQSSISRMLGVNNNSQYPTVQDVYHTISIPSPRVLDIYNQEKRLSVPFIGGDSSKPLILNNKNAAAVIIPPKRKRTFSEKSETEVNRPMYRDDIFFNASLTRLPQYTSQSSLAYNLSVTRLPTKNDVEEGCTICPEAFKRTLATMLDFTLLRSPSFILLAVGGFFTMMGFYVPFMYLCDRAIQSGMEVNSAIWLLSSIGIANTVGRVLCGLLGSFPGVNALFINNAALTIGGIATIFSGLSMSAEYQFTYCVVFGLAISCFASLRSIIVVDLLGLDRLTNAFGLLLLFQGVAAAIGAPLAGAFMEAIGSYDASFYLSGGMLLFSAIICYPLNYINKREVKALKEKEGKSVPV